MNHSRGLACVVLLGDKQFVVIKNLIKLAAVGRFREDSFLRAKHVLSLDES